MAMRRPQLCEDLWNNMDFSHVMKVDGRMMKTLFDRGLLEVEVKDLRTNLRAMFREKGVDVTPLKSLIAEKIDTGFNRYYLACAKLIAEALCAETGIFVNK
jgi:hypothetical protein